MACFPALAVTAKVATLMLWASAVAVVVGSPTASGAATTVTFDPPTYAAGQLLTNVPGAAGSPGVRVYAASDGATTTAGPNAARSPQAPCGDVACSSGANRLSMSFPQG